MNTAIYAATLCRPFAGLDERSKFSHLWLGGVFAQSRYREQKDQHLIYSLLCADEFSEIQHLGEL